MDAARKGIATPQMKIVAEKEKMQLEELMGYMAEGKVVIPANINHQCINPEGVGSMLRTKINVNLGVSRDCKDYDIELQKVMSAVNMIIKFFYLYMYKKTVRSVKNLTVCESFLFY